MNMKRIAASVLWLQMVLFALGTIYLAWLFLQMVLAGAGFVPGLEAIEQRRLIARLAPYLVLPFGAALSFLLFRKGRYRAAASLSFVIAAGAFVAGQLYLTKVPDPIVENFEARFRRDEIRDSWIHPSSLQLQSAFRTQVRHRARSERFQQPKSRTRSITSSACRSGVDGPVRNNSTQAELHRLPDKG
jgi:hypothetical protein